MDNPARMGRQSHHGLLMRSGTMSVNTNLGVAAVATQAMNESVQSPPNKGTICTNCGGTGIIPINPAQQWRLSHQALLHEWKRQAAVCLWLQIASHYHYSKINNWLTYPTVIITAFTSVGVWGIEGSEAGKYIMSSVSLFAGILATVSKHCRAAEKSNEYQLRSKEYLGIIREIDYILALDEDQRPEVGETLLRIRSAFDRIMDLQLDPPLSVIRLYEERFKSLESSMFGSQLVKELESSHASESSDERGPPKPAIDGRPQIKVPGGVGGSNGGPLTSRVGMPRSGGSMASPTSPFLLGTYGGIAGGNPTAFRRQSISDHNSIFDTTMDRTSPSPGVVGRIGSIFKKKSPSVDVLSSYHLMASRNLRPQRTVKAADADTRSVGTGGGGMGRNSQEMPSVTIGMTPRSPLPQGGVASMATWFAPASADVQTHQGMAQVGSVTGMTGGLTNLSGAQSLPTQPSGSTRPLSSVTIPEEIEAHPHPHKRVTIVLPTNPDPSYHASDTIHSQEGGRGLDLETGGSRASGSSNP